MTNSKNQRVDNLVFWGVAHNLVLAVMLTKHSNELAVGRKSDKPKTRIKSEDIF